MARNQVRAASVFCIEMHSLDTQDGRSRRIRGRNTLLAGCGTAVVAFVLAAFGYLAWANALPPPEVDRRVFPNPNGYDACVAAVADLPAWSTPGAPWNADLEALRKDLAPARSRLAALSAAVRLPYLSPRVAPDNLELLDRYQRSSAQLVSLARLELADGRPGAAMQRTLDVIELGAKMGRGGPLIDCQVGTACVEIGQDGAERCIARLSADEAWEAGRRLDGILTQLPHPADVTEQERRYSLMRTREVFAGRTPIASWPVNVGHPVTAVDQFKARVLLLVYPKSWGYGQVDRYWRALAVELRKPYAKRSSPLWSLPEEDPVLGGEFRELDNIQLPFAWTQAALGLLRVELALREYRMRHSAYPTKLQQLTPAEMSTVPVDPFSDRPLCYRRLGSAYVLYSVGPNLKDDGGYQDNPFDTTGDLVAGKLFPRATPRTPPTSP